MNPPRPYRADDRDAFHALLRDPVLLPQFGWLLDNHELDDPLNHPFAGPAEAWVAEGDSELAGFSCTFCLDSPRGAWGLIRVGVRARYRRKGLGRSLVAVARTALGRKIPRGSDAKISYWEPSPGGEAFARRLGFEPGGFFWEMHRPGRDAPDVTWPAGVEVRTCDESEQAIEDWSECSNASFAENPMMALSTVEQCRMLTRQPHFRPSGLLLAYREDRCVGFCRCALHPDRGDLDILGVIPEARGIGLGRALVRWGTAWLLAQGTPQVRLTVDGKNTRASALYTSEGFEVLKTRRIWTSTLV